MTSPGEKMQKQILDILRVEDAPLSAYQILSKLRVDHSKLAPPTVYRALTSLTADGKVHKLESRSAFVACQHDHHQQTSVLSICNACDAVEESLSAPIMREISRLSESLGFTADKHVIEIHGTCATCKAS